MPLIAEQIQNVIANVISSIVQTHSASPYVFLTEDDVRCRFYNLLFNEFNGLQPTRDNPPQQSISLHSEVRWYGNNRKLKYRSDIVIMDVATLRVKELFGLQLPSKGYGFNRFHAIVEIKLRRANGGSDQHFFAEIKSDIKKLSRIKEEVDPNYNVGANFYMLCLDNKGDISDRVCALQNPDEGFIIHYSRLIENPNTREAMPSHLDLTAI